MLANASWKFWPKKILERQKKYRDFAHVLVAEGLVLHNPEPVEKLFLKRSIARSHGIDRQKGTDRAHKERFPESTRTQDYLSEIARFNDRPDAPGLVDIAAVAASH